MTQVIRARAAADLPCSPGPEPSRLSAVDKALTVLDVLSEADRAMRLSEIARRACLAKSTPIAHSAGVGRAAIAVSDGTDRLNPTSTIGHLRRIGFASAVAV